MADAQDANNASEPSMEEILASIRRIISDEKEPAAAAAATGTPSTEDVLELTQMVQEDGSVVDLGAAPSPAVTKEPVMAQQPEEEKQPESVPEIVVPEIKKEDPLVSDQAASAATSSLAALASTVQIERMASMPMTPLGNPGRTLEDIVIELMRPVLKEWLDKNLPALVDRHVQKEVERIARRVQD